MRRMNIAMMLFFAVLFFCLLMPGCKTDSDSNPGGGDPGYIKADAQGKLLILQAYGNAGDGSPGGVSHSFVELYNITDQDLNLSGIGLYYANGISGENVSEDSAWQRQALIGTIPAKGSFLILGKEHSDLTNTYYKMAGNSGDINTNNLSLSRRGFKVALIQGTGPLTVQNPFIARNGGPISGYIDMVGAVNNLNAANPDNICGYEYSPARNSAAVAVRRQDLTDLDNNSTDFISLRYARGIGEMTDEEVEVYRPRSAKEKPGGWDPFEGYQGPYVEPGTADPYAGELLIFQAYGPNSSAAGASHSFVELYNTTGSPISLSGISLYYADGTTVSTPPNTNTADGPWKKIALSGTIPAKGSFLILGPKISAAARYQIPDGYGDINSSSFVLSNRAFKVALIHSTYPLAAQNPFDMDGSGTKADGYIDMLGAANEYSDDGSLKDRIFGFEGAAPARVSGSEAARRINNPDTDDNFNDFIAARYASDGMSDEELSVRHPRNANAGGWDPFEVPPVDPGPSKKLMILQIGAATDGNISHSFVELYNNSDVQINLGGYSIQYAEGTRETDKTKQPNTSTTDGPWQKIDLTGTIDPHHSFLILGNKGIGQTETTNPALSLAGVTGDMNESFVISNRSFKVVLMSNTTLLTVQNPFDIGGSVSAAGYLDMVGAMNTVGEDKINGYETNPITDLNKQTGQRRTSLKDTDDNNANFARAVYAGATPAEREIRRPKTHAYGAWNPITGEAP